MKGAFDNQGHGLKTGMWVGPAELATLGEVEAIPVIRVNPGSPACTYYEVMRSVCYPPRDLCERSTASQVSGSSPVIPEWNFAIASACFYYKNWAA